MTAIMVKAVVGALKAFPNFNSSIDMAAGELVVKHYYHIGVAVDTEFGLLVPVIRDADRKTVLTIAAELGELAAKARDRKLDAGRHAGGNVHDHQPGRHRRNGLHADRQLSRGGHPRPVANADACSSWSTASSSNG